MHICRLKYILYKHCKYRIKPQGFPRDSSELAVRRLHQSQLELCLCLCVERGWGRLGWGNMIAFIGRNFLARGGATKQRSLAETSHQPSPHVCFDMLLTVLSAHKTLRDLTPPVTARGLTLRKPASICMNERGLDQLQWATCTCFIEITARMHGSGFAQSGIHSGAPESIEDCGCLICGNRANLQVLGGAVGVRPMLNPRAPVGF